MRGRIVSVIACVLLATGCSGDNQAEPTASSPSEPAVEIEAAAQVEDAGGEPIESTGSHKVDLITTDDPSTFACLVDLGRGEGEIFDQRTDTLAVHPDAFLYLAHFDDGTSIAIRLHPEFGTEAAARAEVDRYTTPLGQLPTVLRSDIERIAVLKGDETAQGDGGGEGIHIHSGNAGQRIADNRLEETLFHESIHTSLDDRFVGTTEWQQAQVADGLFLTSYGRENPGREDFAETALYAFALVYHADRVPDAEAAAWRARVPARLAFFDQIFAADEPIFTDTGTAVDCDA